MITVLSGFLIRRRRAVLLTAIMLAAAAMLAAAVAPIAPGIGDRGVTLYT